MPGGLYQRLRRGSLDGHRRRLEQGTPTLTVSDMDRFIQKGGMVGFILDESRVRFNINLTATQEARLKISSQLLKLAKMVTGKPAGDE